MSAGGKWLDELYRIGALRSFLGHVTTGLSISCGALCAAALIDCMPIRFVICLIGAAFAASSLGTLYALTDKMDRDQ